MTKRVVAMSIAFLFAIILTACGMTQNLLNQEKAPTSLPSNTSETISATENISASDSQQNFAKGLDYAKNEDWLKAYACYLAVDELELQNTPGYTDGVLDTAIAQCHNAVAVLGKQEYDNEDYIAAYQYWSICNITGDLDYSQEYGICQLINTVQGRKYDRRNFDKTIFIDGTTIIVDSENADIPKGNYTTYLGERTNNSGGKEQVLFFDNGNYILKLPETADYPLTLLDLTKDFPDNVKLYYSLEDAQKANEEGQRWAEYQREQERIRNSPPQIGMNRETVEMSAWGKPTKIRKTTYEWGTTEQWCYPQNRYVYFRNGIVVAISE